MRLFLNLAWASTPFFLLVGPFPRLLQNPFKKQQVAACRFPKEFCEIQERYQPKSRRELRSAVFKRV